MVSIIDGYKRLDSGKLTMPVKIIINNIAFFEADEEYRDVCVVTMATDYNSNPLWVKMNKNELANIIESFFISR